PFYWHYIKQMGRKGEPMHLTLITDTEKMDEEGEVIHFGSPRLQQIMEDLKSSERFTKLFEQVDTSQGTPLYPWFGVNMKVSYQGKQKKDEMVSIGLHLNNGTWKLEKMDPLEAHKLQPDIMHKC